MKSNLTRRMYVVIVISVLTACAGVLAIVFAVTYNATMADIREQAYGVRDYVIDSIMFTIDFTEISLDGEAGDAARREAQDKLDLLYYVGNFRRLYLAAETESGAIVTTLILQSPDGIYSPYVPTGVLYSDLRRSLDERTAIMGSGMYPTEQGRTYPVFWPMLVNMEDEPIAVVGMEFDVDSSYQTLRNIIFYSLAFSLILIVLVLIVAYLLMGKTSEPFYKKMAYLDFLTGIQNRLSYEQRLVQCESLVAKGISVTIVIFDVNKLKTVNDTQGHRQGDRYITNTAKIISELVGSMGDTYRIGGDEFAAIIVDREQASIDKLLDELRKEKRPVLSNIPFNCAFGAATFTPGVDSGMNDLANRADKEMYMDKHRVK